ncbi:hypothetical protein PB2503_06397 [Parvularcula bermudensis HTCC2503]|uniref:non-specific protein-tyrosine kinase n=1 Tax=Parvularcula bermudensis (strain ATCC BAA-594 / HTCC2503 / KCTC 12087) TaxID=314260 RepID=E0THP9_PARBH|nr:AAA family ATPase [Parvularcula bermudensis]ADM09345.1 hypothetical protein PB2503_06397 [Parvularcula bermudensis HTCC2503]
MTAYSSIPLSLRVNENDPRAGIDVPGLWRILRRRLRLFAAAAVLTLAVVMAITFQLTPIYASEARVVLNARETQALDVSAIIAGISPDAATVDTEVQLIASRSLARKVADDLNLYADPEFNPTLTEEEGWLSRLLPEQLRRDEQISETVMRERTLNRLMEAVDVQRAGITYAIKITAESRDPEMAARLANAFAESYVVDTLDQKFDTYELISNHLDEAVAEHQEKLRIAENAVERYRADNGLLSAKGSLLAEQQISDLQAELIIQEAELSERQAKLFGVNRRLSLGANLDGISDVLASPVIGSLRAQQAELSRRRADLENRYGPLHPSLDKLQSEEVELSAKIDAEIERIVGSLRNDVDVARQRVTTLKQSIADLRNSLTDDNQALVRLRELERIADVNRRNYEQLLQRSQQADLFENLAEADARIADEAFVPTTPVFPNTKINLALGLLLGGAMGAFMIVLAEIFDSGLRTEEDIERQLGTKLIAAVPLLSAARLKKAGSQAETYVLDKPLSPFAESYRTLRSALVLGSGKAERGQVVAITSAVSGEGKTVSALALGRIAAMSGDRVLLVDCDIRRRVLSSQFSSDDVTIGLAEIIGGEALLDEALVDDDRSDMTVLPVREDRSGQGDLFSGRGFAAFLEQVRQSYDLIILDTAPLSAVADSRAVASAADRVVHCVRWKQTPVVVAKNARKILGEIDTVLMGTLLTQVDVKAQSGYGYQGSERYYGQNGRYYAD